MGAGYRILETFINFHLKKIKKVEDDLFQTNDVYKASDSSPSRFNKIYTTPVLFNNGKPFSLNLRSVLFLNSFFKDIRQSVEPYINLNPFKNVDISFFKELKKYIKYLKINNLGYCHVPREFVYRNMAIPHKNAFVLILKMNTSKLGEESVHKGNLHIFRTYKDLWQKTLKLSTFLRNNGYSAYPGHPFLGTASYILLAKNAGLGWIGKNGLLITPEFGSRVILSAVYTSIENLPEPTCNIHSWIEDYCEYCKLCIRSCPTGAILIDGLFQTKHGSFRDFNIEKCYNFLSRDHGYDHLNCIEKCPFNIKGYYQLKHDFRKTS